MRRSATRQRASQAREEAYRESICGAGERIFGNQGVENTKVQEIAAEAGVSVGTFYAVFPNKWEVYRAIQRLRTDELLECMATARLSKEETILDVLLRGTANCAEYLMRHPDCLRFSLRLTRVWEFSSEAPGQEEELACIKVGGEVLTRAFQRGIDQGIFLDHGAGRMARLMGAMMRVHLQDWTERGSQEPVEVVIEELQDLIKRAFCTPQALLEAQS